MISYYRDILKFTNAKACATATVQDDYDKSCLLMIQTLSNLEKEREIFFHNLKADLEIPNMDDSEGKLAV